MTVSYADIAITALIIGVVLFAAHRLGQVNPIGTGKLARRLSAVELKVAEQGEKLDNLDRMLGTLATSANDAARELAAMRVEMAGDRGLEQRTWDAVSRLEHFFIEEAFRARRGDK